MLIHIAPLQCWMFCHKVLIIWRLQHNKLWSTQQEGDELTDISLVFLAWVSSTHRGLSQLLPSLGLPPSLPPSLTHPPTTHSTHPPIHPLTHSLTHPPLPIHPSTRSLTHPHLTHSTHTPIHPLTHSFTHPLTHPPTIHSPNHPPTHPLTHSLTHSLTHPTTHSLNHPPTLPSWSTLWLAVLWNWSISWTNVILSSLKPFGPERSFKGNYSWCQPIKCVSKLQSLNYNRKCQDDDYVKWKYWRTM